MITLDLIQIEKGPQGTFSGLYHEGHMVCYVGELPWRGNSANISCIPPGEYRVEYMARSASGRYRDVYHIQGVPNRSGILQHPGNLCGDRSMGLLSHSHGCQLPGLVLGKLNGQRAVLASRSAMQKIHQTTGRQAYTLRVHR